MSRANFIGAESWAKLGQQVAPLDRSHHRRCHRRRIDVVAQHGSVAHAHERLGQQSLPVLKGIVELSARLVVAVGEFR